MRKKLILIVLSFIAVLLHSQEAKVDIGKINSKYNDCDKMSFSIRYELYFDNQIKPSDVINSIYKKKGDNYLITGNLSELMINKHHVILVDKDERTIIVDKSNINKNSLGKINIDLDSVFNYYSKIEKINTINDKYLKGYKFYLEFGPVSVIEILFNRNTYEIKEITSTYREKMPDENDVLRNTKLKLSFSQYNLIPIKSNDFNVSNYVVKVGKEIKPVSSFSSFKVLTNLLKL